MRVYRIREGETAAEISAKQGIPLSLIVKYNGAETLLPGDCILLPEERVPCATVQPSETAAELSRRLNLPIEEILERAQAPYLYPFLKIPLK